MTEMPEGDEGWRVYDSPMSACTTAMLNINGATEEQPSTGPLPMLYEIYKSPSGVDKITDKNGTEIWSTSSAPSATPSPVTSQPKVTNGVLDSELLFMPDGKREPEDLTRKVYLDEDKVTRLVKSNGVIVKEVKVERPGATSVIHTNPNLHIDDGLTATGKEMTSSSSVQQQPYFGQGGYDHLGQYGLSYTSATAVRSGVPATVYTTPTEFYRDYTYGSDVYQHSETVVFGDRYVRQTPGYKGSLTVDLSSPDSGIGGEAITPRNHEGLQFEYADPNMCQQQLDQMGRASTPGSTGSGPRPPSATATRPWHDYGRQNEADKIHVPKVYPQYGFRYHLESPISTSQRREDDRVTYINKGQFYGITMEYIPDPDRPLKSSTVKSTIMLLFREEKTPEDEIKAWQYWHGRQHSVKQRILDADTKNSAGLVNCIEELAHNAITVYWNPLESAAKVNIAVQCLSTDFSSQKGVKGLPLHLQIDTVEDMRDTGYPVFHRGYSQIKIFCDKGAERKTRDEERRAAKRKMTVTGRKKLDELYHSPCERTEFYHMADLAKIPVLFTPSEDADKMSNMELGQFYTDHDGNSNNSGEQELRQPITSAMTSFPIPTVNKSTASSTIYKFHNTFLSEDKLGDNCLIKKESIEPTSLPPVSPIYPSPPMKRPRLTPSPSERLMLYVRQDKEEAYIPLHLIPPNTVGLLAAIEIKYKISPSSIKNLYRKNRKGILARIDDDMLRHYCNEDTFLIEIKQVDGDNAFEVTLIESIDDHHLPPQHIPLTIHSAIQGNIHSSM